MTLERKIQLAISAAEDADRRLAETKGDGTRKRLAAVLAENAWNKVRHLQAWHAREQRGGAA